MDAWFVLLAALCFITGTASQTLDELIAQAGQQSGSAFENIGLSEFCCEGVSYDEPQQDDGSVLVELDIRYTREAWQEIQRLREEDGARRARRKATRHGGRWTNKIVPYHLSNVFTSANLAQIQAAITEWETYTCLDFRPATNNDRNYIFLQNGGGCSSYVGMIGNSQAVSLAPGCRVKGIIVHELGHAIGFHHEQTRPDRDSYVTIYHQNIQRGTEFNFQKYTTETINDFSVPYDYYSVMHYGKTAFTVNGRLTIVTKDPAFQDVIGNRAGLSFRDIKLANLMYNCNEGCPGKTCTGEGFVGKDCQCWCPGADRSSVVHCSGGGGGGGGGDECSADASGPHDLVCLRQWWADAGCSPEGISSPDNSPDNVKWWNKRSGHAVKSDMNLYFQYAGEQLDNYYEKCHGSAEQCPANNQGPHTMKCLRKWWEDAGCSPDGTSSPDNDRSNVDWWNERSGQAVRNDMALYFQYSSQGNSNYRTRCLGDSCGSSQGSHSMGCLRKWWQEAGCSPDGVSSPDNSASNVKWWNERSDHAVKADMALYALYAGQGHGDYPSKCHGRGQACTNTEEYCEYWAGEGYCTVYRDYMTDNCAKACSLCGNSADPAASCLDRDRNCHAWATMGECYKNPAYMLINCARACAVCSS